jgi:hypothetical protein
MLYPSGNAALTILGHLSLPITTTSLLLNLRRPSNNCQIPLPVS